MIFYVYYYLSLYLFIMTAQVRNEDDICMQMSPPKIRKYTQLYNRVPIKGYKKISGEWKSKNEFVTNSAFHHKMESDFCSKIKQKEKEIETSSFIHLSVEVRNMKNSKKIFCFQEIFAYVGMNPFEFEFSIQLYILI